MRRSHQFITNTDRIMRDVRVDRTLQEIADACACSTKKVRAWIAGRYAPAEYVAPLRRLCPHIPAQLRRITPGEDPRAGQQVGNWGRTQPPATFSYMDPRRYKKMPRDNAGERQ